MFALWRFEQETIEDIETATLHRPGCRQLDDATSLEVRPAGSSVRRDAAPRECWACQPAVELVLGV